MARRFGPQKPEFGANQDSRGGGYDDKGSYTPSELENKEQLGSREPIDSASVGEKTGLGYDPTDRESVGQNSGLGYDATDSASVGERTGLGGGSKGGERDQKPAEADQAQESKSWIPNRLRGKITRKRAAGGIVAVALVGGGFGGFAILQGPFQVIHFAQNLQKHFRGNEDAGNDRTSKMLLYGLAGKGAQNGRLGVVGNKVANNWEKKLIEQTGMRPVYQDPNRRFVGFEIVDEKKAHNFLGDVGNQEGRNAAKLEKVMGSGAKISDGGDNIKNGAEDGTKNKKFVDLRNVSFGGRRAFIRSVGRATDTRNISSSVGSRMLIKRAGVNFHPLNKLKKRTDESIAKFLEKRDKEVSEGVEDTDRLDVADSTDTDGDGTEDAPKADDVEVSEKSKSYIDEFKKSGLFKSTTSGTIIVGLMCSVKSYGDQIEDYKYQNNVLPMMRMGMNTITEGNQVMSFDDFDLPTLSVLADYLYDKEKKTSWTQAESIRANQGKTGGSPIPKEAALANADEKPEFFQNVDKIPFLGAACSIQSGILGLPVIKQVTGALGDVSKIFVDSALSIFHTDSEELLQQSLRVVSGKSVDPRAKGAARGSLSDTGAFLAANEQAIGSGGSQLNDEDRAKLALYLEESDQEEFQQQPMYARYLNPFDRRSLASSLIDSTPSSSTETLARIGNPFESMASMFTNLFAAFTPHAKAASTYNYGVPMYGFSLDERKSDLYENPYENGLREANGVKLQDDLDRLNEEYGEPCFGVKVTSDDATGVHIEQIGEVNVFKMQKVSKCNAAKNTDDRFNQYRMYILDSMTVLSLACYDGDDDACKEVGAGTDTSGSSEAEESSSGTGQAGSCGDSKSVAQEILDNKAIGGIDDDADVKEDLQNTAAGKPAYSNVNLNPNLLCFLKDAASEGSLTIEDLTGHGASHSPGSNHYKGIAVDIRCVGIGTDVNKLIEIGKRYNVEHNGELCDRPNPYGNPLHDHFDAK